MSVQKELNAKAEKVNYGAVMRNLMKSVRDYKPYTVATPLLVLGEVACEMTIPFVTANLIDTIKVGATVEELLPTSGLLVLLAITSLFFGAAAGITCTEYTFTDSNDVSSVTQKACDDSDVLYIPTDNTAASNTEAIANVVLAAGTPVIAGEAGICKGCGVATLSISYYDLGYATGKMAVKILTGEADISTMPVEYAPQVTKKYNAANCEALNVTVPDDYIAIED